MGPTRWATIVISDANTIESQELIFLASSDTVSVCLSNATTGQPFISTLELRPFNGSIYLTPFENQFFLSVSARINFGAENEDPVRFPDDPFDRLWESDLVKKENYLVDVAAGTERVSTDLPIDIGKDEQPPQKVMQTAVVGRNGNLTCRMNLDGFPGSGWAYTYFAEIEDLGPTKTRKFRLVLPGEPELSKAFGKTSDSSEGPLVNAIEINKYLKISVGSLDGAVAASFISGYKLLDWAVKLSRKNLTGSIPSDFASGSSSYGLRWLDGNVLDQTRLDGPVQLYRWAVSIRLCVSCLISKA
ncbi:probable LRR receptor-like serine/threonine-protein kinase [Tanacetum coccineum]